VNGLILTLFAGLAPQIVPANAEAVLVAKATRDGRLDLTALALGDGGVRPVVGPARGGAAAERPGEFRTPGGVRIRVRAAGARFDFPAGRALLVSPDGRIHLRSGERTLPFLRGVRLVFADGAEVAIRRGASPRRPLASVEVRIGERSHRLWTAGRRVVQASHARSFTGTTLLALGDGGSLFTTSRAGPLIALERVLCPRHLAGKTPPRRLIVAGDLLAASLRRLPDHAPRRSVQFPQVKEAAQRFAALGDLFDRHTPRPAGATGELWFPLRNEFRLKVDASTHGGLRIGLYGRDAGVPGVEWTISGRTELHFVRPAGGQGGGPRYFLRGIDLREDLERLLPGRSNGVQRAAVQRLVVALGGRAPAVLDVRRR
jgi:hypothetical protein